MKINKSNKQSNNACTIITSLYSKKEMTPAGVAFVATALKMAGINSHIIDLSGCLEYYNSPEELYTDDNSELWLNPDSIKKSEWIDKYLPCQIETNNVVLFSSLFSPDVIFHSRLSYNIKKSNPNIVTAIGGCALATMDNEQIKVISNYFDYILIGHDVRELLKIVSDSEFKLQKKCVIEKRINPPDFPPDYSLVKLNKLVTVYSGHGCYYGKCRFCDYPTRAYQKIVLRSPKEVASDIHQVYSIFPEVEDIVLTLDSYTKNHLMKTLNEIIQYGGHIPYNLMLRAEQWISDDIGKLLAKSGCTEVFIGAEALDDKILRVINKGIKVNDIIKAIKILSKYVDVTIGMILFIPGVDKNSINNQLNNIKILLPYLNSIEPEILTIFRGSEFAINPSKYGIQLFAKEYLLNDSWCFGLSQDIPWTMINKNLINEWLDFSAKFKDICFDYVKAHYWNSIDEVEQPLT